VNTPAQAQYRGVGQAWHDCLVIVFLLFVVLLLIGFTTAAVMGKISGFMADAATSRSFDGIPRGSFSTDDLVHLHFDQALRGYRMDQVDEVIDALCERVRALESEVAARKPQE
jgi:DivIVA domain-containing protein